MKNQITFYVSDEEKVIYKDAKVKAKQEGKKISNVIVNFLSEYTKVK